MLPGWSIFRPWPTSRGKTKCFIWAADLIMGSMAFCISGGKQYRQQRAAFWAGLCICRQHCAVNGINVRKIIRCLLLPQFAVRQLIAPHTPRPAPSATTRVCKTPIALLKNAMTLSSLKTVSGAFAPPGSWNGFDGTKGRPPPRTVSPPVGCLP